MDERREHERQATPTITLRVGDRDQFKRRYLLDLSLGGLFVRTSQTLAIGQEIQIKLEPPEWDTPLALTGRVVRHAIDGEGGEIPGMGIAFLGLDDETRDRLNDLLREYACNSPKDDAESLEGASEEELRSEVWLLRRRLREMNAQLAGLHEENERFEEYDRASRTLMSRLLDEQQRLREESASSADDRVAKLQDDLEQAREQFEHMLAGEQHHAQELLQELMQEQSALDEERKRAQDLETQVARLTAELAERS